MRSLLIPIAVTLAGGIAVALQNPLASLMGRRIGPLGAAFVVHAGGTLVAGALLFIVPGGRLAAWRTVPWYALWCGGLGVVLVAAVAYAIPRLGVAGVVAIIVAAQLTVGLWLDHAGYLEASMRALDPARLLGAALLLVGAWLVVR